MRRPWILAMCLASLGALAWGVWQAVSARRFESGMVRVRQLMENDQFGEAREWLRRVPARWAGNPEVAYSLGVCEPAHGNFQGALDAWAQVEPRLDRPGRTGTLLPHWSGPGKFTDREVFSELLGRTPSGRGASYPRRALLLGGTPGDHVQAARAWVELRRRADQRAARPLAR